MPAPSPSAPASATASSPPSSTPRASPYHNLASLPHISVAGAIATATHGSGIHNGNLATAVRALEIVTANGDVLHLSRDKDGDQFLAAVVGLGAVGIVTRVTLDLQPTFQVAQTVYQNLSFSSWNTTSTRSSAPATASASSPTGRTTAPPRSGSSAASHPGETHKSAA